MNILYIYIKRWTNYFKISYPQSIQLICFLLFFHKITEAKLFSLIAMQRLYIIFYNMTLYIKIDNWTAKTHIIFLSNNWNITEGDKVLTLKYSSNQAFSWPWQWVPLWTCPGSEWPSRPPRWFSPPPSWCTPTHCSHPKTSDSHSVSIVSYLDWY